MNFVIIANLYPTKGVDTAICAMALLRGRGHTLTIFGDGPEKKRLMELCEELNLNYSNNEL